jgi:hypothetical protein
MANRVPDQFRKNDLSLSPGGDEVTAIHDKGKILIYDKIKNINAYCRKLKADPTVIEIRVNDQTYWKR